MQRLQELRLDSQRAAAESERRLLSEAQANGNIVIPVAPRDLKSWLQRRTGPPVICGILRPKADNCSGSIAVATALAHGAVSPQ